MTLEYLANDSMTLGNTEATDPTPTTATVTKLSVGSSKVSADGGKCYGGNLSVLIAGATNGTCTQVAPIAASISPTATKTFIEGDAALREGDEGETMSISGVLSGGGACLLNVTPYIKTAGQSKVSGQ